MRGHYGELTLPVVVIAGSGDLVVSHRQAERLHAEIQGSELQLVEGAGHMVHHVATSQIVNAIERVMERAHLTAKPSQAAVRLTA